MSDNDPLGAKALDAEWKAKIAAAGAMTEEQMRDATVPRTDTPEALTAYIDSLVNRPHDYGTCVYAMSMAATAAFNYVAHALGVTGFQASCADLDVVRRTRNLKGPYMLLDGENALYPQYDLANKVKEWLDSDDMKAWLKEEALKRIAEAKAGHPAHVSVIAHWEILANS